MLAWQVLGLVAVCSKVAAELQGRQVIGGEDAGCGTGSREKAFDFGLCPLYPAFRIVLSKLLDSADYAADTRLYRPLRVRTLRSLLARGDELQVIRGER